MDPFSMLVAVGIAASSFGAGRLFKRRRRAAAALDPSEPVCRCRHSLAFHDPETGRCHAMVNDQPTIFNSIDRPIAWSKAQCECRQYVGPASPEQILASFTPPPPPPSEEKPAIPRETTGLDEIDPRPQ